MTASIMGLDKDFPFMKAVMSIQLGNSLGVRTRSQNPWIGRQTNMLTVRTLIPHAITITATTYVYTANFRSRNRLRYRSRIEILIVVIVMP